MNGYYVTQSILIFIFSSCSLCVELMDGQTFMKQRRIVWLIQFAIENDWQKNTWKLQSENTVENCSAWYMKIIWKIPHQFTDAQINCLIIVYSTIHLYLYVTALLTSYIVKKQQIFSSLSFYKHYHLLWIVHMVFKIYWRRVLIFGSFCSVKLTGYPPVQYNYGCNKFFPKLECVCLSYYYQFCCSVVFCLTFSKKRESV